VITVNGIAQTVAVAETSAGNYCVIVAARVTVGLNSGGSKPMEFSDSGASGIPDLDHIVV